MEFFEPETEQQVKSEHTDAKTEEVMNNFGNKVESVATNIEANTTKGWSSINGIFSNFQKNLPTYLADSQKTLNETKEQAQKRLLETREQAQKRLLETRENLGKNLGNLNLQDKIPLKEDDVNAIKEKSGILLKSATENTNKYLDDLDSDLEKLENLTLGYASKFGSFFKQTTGINLNFVSTEVDQSGEKKDEILFNLNNNKLASNRVEAQLKELTTNKDIYLKNELNVTDYKLTEEEEKESKVLLDESTDLKKLFEELVPESIKEDDFWKIYYVNKTNITEEEKKRKELLEKKPTEDDDDDFDWGDDDDEEEDEEETPKENTTPVKAESISDKKDKESVSDKKDKEDK